MKKVETKPKSNQNSVNDILGSMTRANDEFSYEVFIPSLNRMVMFRQLTTKQQKNLVKSIVDSPIFNTEFIMAFRNVIKENCTEDINVDTLTVFDKLLIALKMRTMSIDDKISITMTSNSNPNGVKRVISLTDVYKECLEKIKLVETTLTDDKGLYTVECSIPTIGDEFNMEYELRGQLTNKISLKTEEDARKALADVYINEFVKYIKKITIKNEGLDEIVVNMKDYGFTDRIIIASKIPGVVNTEIFKYIKSVQDEFNKAILFVAKDENGQNVEYKLKLEPDFFILS